MTRLIPFTGRVNETTMQEWLRHLNDNLTDAKIVPLEDLNAQEISQTECVVVANPDPHLLESLPNLKWIQSLWAGVERLVSEFRNENVSIVRLIDPQLSKTMSEAALAWSLFLHREMPSYLSQQRTCDWIQHDLPLPQERTIGVLGLGALGRSVALRLAKNDFHVVGWSRSPSEIPGVKTFHGADGLPNVLGQSDILLILLPQSPETIGLFGPTNIAKVKPNASIINFGRGPIIDDNALIAALDSGHIKHAVLDVFAVEPLPESHPFWKHEAVTVLPHCSAPTSKKTGAKIAANNISNFIRANSIPTSVNRKLGY